MVALATDQRDVIAFLSDSRTFGLGEAVEIHETHGSLVFLAGEHAFKLKRAVKYPYMDYSTPDRRRRMCERELAVNHGMAPKLYQEVRAIVRSCQELHFGRFEDSNAVDWVVVMQRFDQSQLLESRRRGGLLTRDDMLALAEAIARYHGAAEIISGFGGACGMRAIVEENVAILNDKFGGSGLANDVEQLGQRSQSWLLRVRDVLGRRRQAGFVRRCHGDLHLNNVCMMDGAPVLFDAIEFNDVFSCIDVAYDLAFILMDLDSHGLRAYANVLLNRYLELTEDYSGLVALPLFLSCRAAIRSHVAISTRQNATGGAVETSAPENLLQAAVAYLEPRKAELIAIGGISGTGKSTLAGLLAPAFGAAPGAIVLRSDVVRKSMWGVAPTERLNENAYDNSSNTAVYRRMREVATLILRGGHSVIVDAVFGDPSEQTRIEAVATEAKVQFHGLWLTAPTAILEQRILLRSRDASDATLTVLHSQIASVLRPARWSPIAADGAPNEVLSEAGRSIGLESNGTL